MFYTKSVTSGGCCSENYYKYGTVVKILSLLMTTSRLILLLVIFCDIGKFQEDSKMESEVLDKTEQMEDVMFSLIQVCILIHFVIQVKRYFSSIINIKQSKGLLFSLFSYSLVCGGCYSSRLTPHSS